MMHPTLFRWGGFKSSAGNRLHWKIDCDALTDGSIQCIANVIAAQTTFSAVYAVPTGGDRLGIALTQFSNDKNPNRVVIVDDVLTTGGSMEAEKKRVKNRTKDDVEIEGWVIFARTKHLPNWINAVFTLEEGTS